MQYIGENAVTGLLDSISQNADIGSDLTHKSQTPSSAESLAPISGGQTSSVVISGSVGSVGIFSSASSASSTSSTTTDHYAQFNGHLNNSEVNINFLNT